MPARWKNLRTRLPLYVVLVSLLPLAGFGYLALDYSTASLRDTQYRASLRTAVLAAALISKTVDDTQKILTNASQNLDLLSLDDADLEWALMTIQRQNPSFLSLTVIDSRGQERRKTALDRVFQPGDLGNRAADPLFAASMQGKDYVSPVQNIHNGIHTLGLAIPLYHPATRQVAAVLEADVNLGQILGELTSMAIGQKGQVYVLDRAGEVIAHNDASVLAANAKLPLEILSTSRQDNETSKFAQYVNPQGIEVLGVFAPVAENGWLVVAERPLAEVMATAESLQRWLWLLFSGVLALILPLTVFFVLRVTRPLQQLAVAADKIGKGDFGERIPITSDNEIGRAATAFNAMAASLEALSRAAERGNWLKTGLALVEEEQRGTPSLAVLTRNVLALVVDYLKAEVGALYVSDGSGRFILAAGYGHGADPQACPVFAPGEGLVGKVAETRQPLVLTNIPNDYLMIRSGLGEAKPKEIVLQPLLFDDMAVGVLEIGAFTPFTEEHKALLAQLSQPIAIAINAANARVALQRALEEAQQLAEEMQSQQEELRAANEELEEQTQALQASEEQLKAQQEELQAANEELEEKTFSLEEQQALLAERNQILQDAQTRLEQNAGELEAASRYKSEFLANMSHELRTPLNSLLILAQDLAANRHGRLSASDVEAAQTIYGSGDELLQLINQILDLSKVEAGKVELVVTRFALSDVAERLAKSFRHVAEAKGLAFAIEFDRQLPEFVVTDFQRVGQILKNLLANAIKFTPAGGVTVRIFQPGEGVVLGRSDLAPTEAFAVAVTDTGIGIPAEKLDDIFGAFQQVDGSISRQYGGTGLGLSISRELAKYLGGELRVDSQFGAGSTFTLFLPKVLERRVETGAGGKTPIMSRPAPKVTELTPPMSHPPAPSITDDRENLGEEDRTILIIEDDLRFARILAGLCRKRHFKYLHAGDGECGLRLAGQYVPTAILLDIRLPGMHGLDVLRALKTSSRLRHIPVHIITVEACSTEAFRQGAIGFLSKPTSREALNEAFGRIEELVSGRIRKLLLVEDDEVQQQSILTLIGNGDVETVQVRTGADAMARLQSEQIDCMVLDLKLPDMTGFQLLEQLDSLAGIAIPPVIIYTGKELTREEEAALQKYTTSIIIKGAHSPERLFDEAALFLHRVVSKLPEHKQRMISALHGEDVHLAEKTILMADDDMRNVFALARVLEDRGMRVLKAGNGRKALEILDNEPGVDLVLMDIMMPEMDGFEAMRRIRSSSRYGEVPILALTAKAMQEDRQKCIEAGANDYLSKPVDIDKLFSLFRVWLHHR